MSALAACRAALRPLVRMLLKHGVMHKEFVELSKEIYVDVARREYGIRGRPTNVSRVVLLTGIGRKAVTAIRDRLEKEAPAEAQAQAEAKQNRIARVLSGWHQDPDYVDTQGKPRVLSPTGAAPSFEDLVRRYGGDVPGVTIQRELKRTGAIRVGDDGAVEVLRRNYRLDTAEPEALTRAGSVLADIGHTVTHNLYRDEKEPSRFEARASNANIPADALPAYRKFVYRESQAFLENVDAWLSRHEVTDTDAKQTAVQRIGLGMYWIQSDTGSESS
ncbi:MAG: DUF6502 family protein [Gammaproteobacteria bacterium]|nr:DUF6502 family protein [Gammaproteobacteria bacterium]